MKKVDAKLSDLYLHNTESTADRSNEPSNEPSNERGNCCRDDGGTRVRLSDGHSFITKIVVDLRPMDAVNYGVGGVDSSYFW